jgi:hypothetical protein
MPGSACAQTGNGHSWRPGPPWHGMPRPCPDVAAVRDGPPISAALRSIPRGDFILPSMLPARDYRTSFGESFARAKACATPKLLLAGRRQPGSRRSHSRSNGSRTTIGSVSDAALRHSGRTFGRASPSPLFVRSLSSFPVPIGAPASSGRACCSGIRPCRCDCASHFSHAMTGATDVRGLISAAQPAAGGSSS